MSPPLITLLTVTGFLCLPLISPRPFTLYSDLMTSVRGPFESENFQAAEIAAFVLYCRIFAGIITGPIVETVMCRVQ